MRIILFCFAGLALMGAELEVNNGLFPKKDAQTLVFSLDLQFGAEEEDDAYLWGDAITKIALDHRGHMYIMDPKENRIIEFDKQGKFVRFAARKGPGPGELLGVQALNVLGDGSFVVMDGEDSSLPKLKFFDKDFNYKRELLATSFSVYPQTMQFSPDGTKFFTYFARIEEETGFIQMKTGISDLDFKVLKEFSSVKRPAPQPGVQDSAYWSNLIAGNLKNLYREKGVAAFGPNGNLYQALSNKYVVTIWDKQLKKTVVISRKHKPIPNSDEHVNSYVDFMTESLLAYPKYQKLITRSILRKAVELADLPPVKRPIFGILPMEDGSFIVVHDINLSTRENLGDIFSPAGEYLGQTRLSNYAMMSHDYGLFETRMIFRNGFAYTITTDEEGDLRAARYRYALASAK